MDTGAIVNLVLLAGLVGITGYYAYQTRRLVRGDFGLTVYVNDPMGQEWAKDTSKIEKENLPGSEYLRIKALLVNPGSVPMVLVKVEENIEIKNGVVQEGRFVLPKIGSSERYGLYVFALPWVIIHDDFAIWYRTYKIDKPGEGDYKLTIKFYYEVGSKERTLTKEISLKPH